MLYAIVLQSLRIAPEALLFRPRHFRVALAGNANAQCPAGLTRPNPLRMQYVADIAQIPPSSPDASSRPQTVGSSPIEGPR